MPGKQQRLFTYLDEGLIKRVESACDILAVEKSAFLRFCVVHTLFRLPEIQEAHISLRLGMLIRRKVGKKWNDERRLEALGSVKLSKLDIDRFKDQKRKVPSAKDDVLAELLRAIGLTRRGRIDYDFPKVTKAHLRSAFRSKVREMINLTQLEYACRHLIQRKSSRSVFLKKSIETHRMLDLILSDMTTLERRLMQELYGIELRQGRDDPEADQSPWRGKFIYTPPAD
jgi:hypothetical protein